MGKYTKRSTGGRTAGFAKGWKKTRKVSKNDKKKFKKLL